MEPLKIMDNPYQLKRLCPNWVKRISLLLCRKQQVGNEETLIAAVQILLKVAQFCETGYGSPTARQAKEEAIALLKEAGIAVEER